MLKRKILNNLIKWKENHKDNCLLVIGAKNILWQREPICCICYNNWHVEKCIKLSNKNIGLNEEKNILTLPLYMSIFLKEEDL